MAPVGACVQHGPSGPSALFEHVVITLDYGHYPAAVESPKQAVLMSRDLHKNSNRFSGGFTDGELLVDPHGKWASISSTVGYNASALICAVLVGAMFGMFCSCC